MSECSGPWGGRAMEALIDALALCRASHLETIGTADAGSMSTCKEARLVTAVVAPANSQRVHNSHTVGEILTGPMPHGLS